MTEGACTADRHWWPKGSPAGTKCECGETEATVNGQRPPFAAGNALRLSHGAFSRYVMPEARELAEEIIEELPRLQDFAAAVLDYAIAQVRVWRLSAHVETHGEFNDRGNISAAVRHLREWQGTAEKLRARLGLDPGSFAKLKLDEARGDNEIGRGLEAGRRALEQRRRRLGLIEGGKPDDDADEIADAEIVDEGDEPPAAA